MASYREAGQPSLEEGMVQAIEDVLGRFTAPYETRSFQQRRYRRG
jgi:hypothetical protein